MEHRGILFERVFGECHPQKNTSQLEQSFALLWAQKNNESPPLLQQKLALGDPDDPRREYIPRNLREWNIAYLVAATVIQWLPTAIGCSFLQEAFEKGGGTFKYTLPEVPPPKIGEQ